MSVMLSGHGGFELDTDPPWVTVPGSATIHFYSENMRALLDSYGGELELMSAAFDAASPSQSVYGGQSCPNYTLYPPDGLNIESSPEDVDQYTVTGPTTLQELIGEGVIDGEVYWAACRVVELEPAGGELLGVNAGQTDFGYEGGEVGVVLDDTAGEVSAADAWIQGFWSCDEAARMEAFNDLPSGYKRLYSDYSPDLATWARQNGFIV